jgi:hypothetical protein
MRIKSVQKKLFAVVPVLFIVFSMTAAIFAGLNVAQPGQAVAAAYPPTSQADCPAGMTYHPAGFGTKAVCVMNNEPGSQADCPDGYKYQPPSGGSAGITKAACVYANPPVVPPAPEPKSQADCPAGTTFRPGGAGSAGVVKAACIKNEPQSQADCPAGTVFVPAKPVASQGATCTAPEPKSQADCPAGTTFTPGKAGSAGVERNTCATPPDDNSADEGPQLECEVSILNPLTWLICPLVTAAQNAVEGLNDGINTMMNINTGKDSAFDTSGETGKHYQTAWNSFRVIATSIIIIGGLLMIISQAAGLEVLDAYTVRKTLPRLLVAAIFITLSWYLVAFLIQLSNDVGNSVRAIIYTPFKDIGSETITLKQDGSLVAGLIGGAALYAIGPLALGTFALSALIAVGVGFVVLIVRKLIILLLIIVAPLAIACYVLPNTQRGWKLWKDTLISMLVVFPIISAFIAIGRVFAIISYTSGGNAAFHTPTNGIEQTFATLAVHLGFAADDNSPGLIATITAFVAYFLPYFLIKKAFDLAGGIIATVGNAVGNAGGGMQAGLRNYRGNRKKLRAEKKAARRQAFLNGNLMKGNGKFAGAVNSIGGTVGSVKHAGLRPDMWGSRMQAGRATHEQQEVAEFMEKNAAFGAIKGNDDYLQATMKNMGGGDNETDWRRYLQRQGYEGRSLEQGVAQIRAAKRQTSNEVFNKAAVIANASTGTGWKEGGPGQMMESINEVTGNDRHTAANMLAQMRGDAGRAQRLDLMGSGFGTQIGALEKMNNGEMTAAEANKEVIGGALFTKDPGQYARARGQSIQLMAPHMMDHIKESHAEVKRARDSGNKEYIYRAERSLAQDYAWIDNLHDTLKHSAPESARILADTVMSTPVTTGRDGKQNTVLDNVSLLQKDQGHMGQAYQQTTKSYDAQRYAAQQGREAVQQPDDH